jgi:site-specific recombinase XerD
MRNNMKNKIVIHFYVKEARRDRNGEAPIYLRITVNGERAEISTDRRINPDNWDKAAERVAGRSEPARVINATLNNLVGKAEKYFSSLDAKDESISVYQIIAELKGKGLNQMTLIKAYEYHINKLKELSGIDYAVTTINKYGYSLSSLKRFLNNIYNKTDIRLCDLDHKFIESYHGYLRTSENLMHNSAAKSIKNLCRIINISITNGWINKNPFKDFSCNYINTPRSYLTEEEVDSLCNKEFTISRLAKVRDVFVFQIYTGLSYIDLAELTEDSIEIGIDGKQWIVINRKKTGTRSSIPLLPRALEVLDKYRIDPLCIAEHKLLPVCTNQRMNGYLKEIADLCEIKKTLTTHLARHTFATTITLSHGVPIETVSKMLGHSDLKTTQIYSKVVDRKVAEDMKRLLDMHNSTKVAASNS